MQLPITARAALVCASAMLVSTFLFKSDRVESQADSVDVADLVFVTDDLAAREVGCDAISVVDARSGRKVAYGESRWSPGRLAITSDAALALAAFTNNEPIIAALSRMPGDRGRWQSTFVPARIAMGGPIAISPDDRVLLLTMVAGVVQKHRLDDIRDGTLDGAIGRVTSGAVADIVFAADSRTAYVVTTDGEVRILDVDRMVYVGNTIAYDPVDASPSFRIRNTFTSLSPDGRYLVINTGGPRLTVVDLVNATSQLIAAPELHKTCGVAFDYATPGIARLAVHGHDRVAVYSFRPDRLDVIGTLVVPAMDPNYEPDRRISRIGSIAWTGAGDAVVAAIGGLREFRIVDVRPEASPVLATRLDFDACELPFRGEIPFDVVTINRPGWPTPTATPSLTPTCTTVFSPTPTTTSNPTATPSPSGTASPSATATRKPSPTSTPTHTRTPTATPVPARLHLPLVLRERCPVDKQRIDAALVIDVSTSMRDNRTTAGRTRLDAALEAAEVFVNALALPLDQAAVVGFNADGWLELGLTGRRADVGAALARIPAGVRQQTRIDLGIQEAHRELVGPRRLAANRPVMILLTDGLANPEPASTAVQRAAEAKADDITIFTIGLGDEGELNVPELTQMATRPDYFYRAPDAEDLAAVYRAIAVELPCPGVRLWGRR